MRIKKVADLKKSIKDILERVPYSKTNESLPAIINGLDLKQNDSVLAIAGSGDQAFAMLEYAARVEVVDKSSDQIFLVKLRAEALRREEYSLFLRSSVDNFKELIKERNCYFSKRGRRQKIRGNLEQLVFLKPSNISEVISERKFSKVYLSNALDYIPCDKRRPMIFNFDDLVIDEELTNKAGRCEFQRYEDTGKLVGYWEPVVYRRKK
ncbi:DUF3419 family protein [archaeon]|nr:DUF3419 family protein [archaeon]